MSHADGETELVIHGYERDAISTILRPMAEETIFSKIIRKEIPAKIVYESDDVLAFRDVNPQAPQHILVIPKRAIESMEVVQVSDRDILGELLLVAAEIAHKEGFGDNGYRLVINTGGDGGQTVPHLHVHILAGRHMHWPPG